METDRVVLGQVAFQSLSLQESIALHRLVGGAILNAYQVGMNVVLERYDKPLDDLLEGHRDALKELGFGHLPVGEAMGMLAISLREQVKRENADVEEDGHLQEVS